MTNPNVVGAADGRLRPEPLSAARAEPDDDAISERALSKLRWRCRRGLLENDLLIERFFARPEPITHALARGLLDLMELADNDLLDVLLRRREPDDGPHATDVRAVLNLMRIAPAAHRHDFDSQSPKEQA